MADPKPKVLIFEDMKDMQFILKMCFQKRNWDPRIAGDGVDAVDLVKEHEPALIVMDMIMPGKGGLETIQDLRREGCKIPIVVLSSKTNPEDRDRALSAGADLYIKKPFSPKELEAAILPLIKA